MLIHEGKEGAEGCFLESRSVLYLVVILVEMQRASVSLLTAQSAGMQSRSSYLKSCDGARPLQWSIQRENGFPVSSVEFCSVGISQDYWSHLICTRVMSAAQALRFFGAYESYQRDGGLDE